jgi:hypothetical protein
MRTPKARVLPKIVHHRFTWLRNVQLHRYKTYNKLKNTDMLTKHEFSIRANTVPLKRNILRHFL